MEAAEAAEKQEEETIADKAGAEAYDPTEATDDADIEEETKNEDVEMEAGMFKFYQISHVAVGIDSILIFVIFV